MPWSHFLTDLPSSNVGNHFLTSLRFRPSSLNSCKLDNKITSTVHALGNFRNCVILTLLAGTIKKHINNAVTVFIT